MHMKVLLKTAAKSIKSALSSWFLFYGTKTLIRTLQAGEMPLSNQANMVSTVASDADEYNVASRSLAIA